MRRGEEGEKIRRKEEEEEEEEEEKEEEETETKQKTVCDDGSSLTSSFSFQLASLIPVVGRDSMSREYRRLENDFSHLKVGSVQWDLYFIGIFMLTCIRDSHDLVTNPSTSAPSV